VGAKVKIKIKLDGKDARDAMAKDGKVAEAFHEVYSKTPRSVVKTSKTGKAKREMMTAIALSKARAAGAKIPKKGGNTRIAADSMKYEGLSGRKGNLAAKAAFRAGPVAREED